MNAYQEKLNIIARVITETASGVDGELCHAVDALAEIRSHIKELQAIEKSLCNELTGDLSLDTETPQGLSARLDGVNHYLTVAEVSRWTLDTKTVRAEMGDEWYNARCKVGMVRTVRTYDAK